ncbi:GntR family transcriptional regulator [Streptomyces griseoincarnatus]|uniref:GntR family transcriptional regulator n=1 Tax=Streptomyces althioticus TaxID=83380 RepID=UPI00346AB717|nr:GntR family transcriptional regulator [Streptomyces althioticus]WTB51182.1 GntR family transcriptional regulator [Streptomyces althioticus]
MSDSQASRRPRRAPQATAQRRLPQPSNRPPYRLLADVLRQQILTGQLGPGDQVPPSRVLEEDYGIANMTARAAVRVLRDEGLVHTVHGLGTFVTNPLPEARAATASAGRTHMPTEEYAELLRRIDQITDVQDALLRLFGQAARLADQPAAQGTAPAASPVPRRPSAAASR